MPLISGVSVNATQADLQKRNVAYSLEFDHDFTILMHHALNQTVEESLSKLFEQIQRHVFYTQSTYDALLISHSVTLNIESEACLSQQDLILAKFRSIQKYDCIYPKGHNLWALEVCMTDFSRSLANKALIKIKQEEADACRVRDGLKPRSRRGRKKKPIYQFQYGPKDPNTGSHWKLIEEWESSSELKKVHPNWSMGNISSACNNPAKGAYGFKWSHNPDTIF